MSLYYPQEYEMEYVTKCEFALHNDKPIMLHSDKSIANGSLLLCNGEQ